MAVGASPPQVDFLSDQHGSTTILRDTLAAALGERYDDVRKIGEGGMAVVFRAVDRRLDRTVAIKVMSPSLREDAEARARFMREAKAAAALAHTNVVPIYAVDTMPDGLPYFSMQYVEGGSLEAVIAADAPFEPERVQSYLRQIAAALESAHRHGIVHRDVKPQNILHDVEGDRLLLTDFGIAKGTDESNTVLTAVGSLVGSPRYMSPEQAAGDPLDQRSDLYSMGVVAYEMLTGKPPFQADTIQRMIICHLTEPPPSLHEARADCPTALLDAVHRCLEKEAGHRYQSAGELLQHLDEIERAANASGPGATVRKAQGGGQKTSAFNRLHPLRRAQIILASALAVAGASVVLDASLLGGATLSVVFVAAAALVLVETAGRMWVDGFELAQLFSLSVEGPEHPSRDRREGLAAGPRSDAVRQSRAERALLLRAFQSLAKSEQAEFPRLRSTADRLFREIARTARELDILDKRIAGAVAEPTPGSPVRLRHRPEEFEEAQLRLQAELDDTMGALKRIREATADYASLGGTVGLDPIRESLDGALSAQPTERR